MVAIADVGTLYQDIRNRTEELVKLATEFPSPDSRQAQKYKYIAVEKLEEFMHRVGDIAALAMQNSDENREKAAEEKLGLAIQK